MWISLILVCQHVIRIVQAESPVWPAEITLFPQEQLNQYRMLHGYKFMHLKCIQAGLVVSQRTVWYLLKILDPQGVQLRLWNRLRWRLYRHSGPNLLWHADSYDKLNPYGICINGAINRFSYMVIWLHAYSTNSNPRVIAGYFTDKVENRSGNPTRIRSDLDTENCSVEQMQIFWEITMKTSLLRDATLPAQVIIAKGGDF